MTSKTNSVDEVMIRTDLKPGDLEQVIQLHGILYQREYQYSSAFQDYVSHGLEEFHRLYDLEKDRVWICEYKNQMVGFLLLMHRPDRFAQLRYFLLAPEFRGKGIGKLLMDRFMQFLDDANYQGAYLWTTNEQIQAAALYTRYGFRLAEEKDSTSFGKPLKEQRYVFLRR